MRCFSLSKKAFVISGNICGSRIKLGRALQIPPITQNELAQKINLMGWDMILHL